MSRTVPSAIVLALLAIAGLSFLVTSGPRQSASVLTQADKKLIASKPAEMVDQLEADLDRMRNVEDPKSGDLIARKAMEAGYALGKSKNYSAARKVFQAVDQKYSGKGAKHQDYGSVPDQAKYQSIVCLVAEGKEEEAKKEFRAFIKERPTSHLAVQAFRRLTRLKAGENDPNDIALYESAIAKQEEATKLAIAACGPKVIQYYLASKLGKKTSLKDIAKSVGQDESGTTMLNLMKGLVAHGVAAEGKDLNAPDFRALKPPYIWLAEGHYVLAEEVSDAAVTVWDPLLNGPRQFALPKEDDAEFRAMTLILYP
ncbi:MAG: hypothetical protein JNK63_07105 [Chthonomonas sp.]|nr:hypothetical protein [Chthonomonas sp.]